MLRAPLVQLAAALAVALVAGAIAGGSLFKALSGLEPTLFVRLSFGIAACSALGFFATLYRVLRGLRPIKLDTPSSVSDGFGTLAFAVAIGALIATTVFR